ncbi:MAG: rRNA maturation RNase YbeY [Patescibacteria group bacterium]|nr:rRNA maturation RNase YbeY [Patescibacteria group bacterium]
MPVDINELSRTGIDHSKIRRIAKSVFRQTRQSLADYQLSIALVDSKTIRRLNNQYRNKNKITTVLSFAYSHKIGEVILAVPEIKKRSKQEKIKFLDNFNRMLVHGILHLLGYGHRNQQQAKKMEKMERIILD